MQKTKMKTIFFSISLDKLEIIWYIVGQFMQKLIFHCGLANLFSNPCLAITNTLALNVFILKTKVNKLLKSGDSIKIVETTLL